MNASDDDADAILVTSRALLLETLGKDRQVLLLHPDAGRPATARQASPAL